MDFVYEEAQELFATGELFAHDVWAAFWGFRFERINRILKKAVNELIEDEEIKNSGIIINLHIDEDTEANEFQIEVLDSHSGEVVNEVTTLNIPRLDATVLSGESVDGPIYAVIDHQKDRKGVYVYKVPLRLDGYEGYHEKFWLAGNPDCYQTNIWKSSFKDIIRIIMNQRYEVQTDQCIDE